MTATAQPLVAAIQMNSGNQLSRNLAVAEQLLREAARQGAALAALPEAYDVVFVASFCIALAGLAALLLLVRNPSASVLPRR